MDPAPETQHNTSACTCKCVSVCCMLLIMKTTFLRGSIILKCLHFIQFKVKLSSAMKIYLRHSLLPFCVDDLNLFVYISESLLNSKCCNMQIHNTWTVVKE